MLMIDLRITHWECVLWTSVGGKPKELVEWNYENNTIVHTLSAHVYKVAAANTTQW